MDGIAALVRLGVVDTTRIGLSGWSYGGYMTTWLIGHYHVWKAAVAGAAVTNLVDQYNMADFNVLERYGFSGFGSPWTGRSEEHTSELQSRPHLVCRLLLEKKKKQRNLC